MCILKRLLHRSSRIKRCKTFHFSSFFPIVFKRGATDEADTKGQQLCLEEAKNSLKTLKANFLSCLVDLFLV